MIDLREKIKNLIEQEKQKGHFWVLNQDNDVELIQQIFVNYELTNDLTQDFTNLPKKAELIFVAAPTGAGKDTLVARLCHKSPEKRYIELNMDIFRHYFSQFIENIGELTDKNFAEMTNEFSYEMYITIQEILLQEFPGTNIIITGTLRDTDWVEKTFERFKADEKTDYDVKLACLAVPKKESAISVIKRYIGIVNINTQDGERLERYPGTARYTSMEYHDETFEKFPKNLEYFQKSFEEEPGRLIDEILVYRRGKTSFDLDEDTKVYSSKDENDDRTALDAVIQLRLKPYKPEYADVSSLVQKILRNKDYLKAQNTLREIIRDLAIILEYPEIVKKLEKLPPDQDSIDEK